MSSLTRRRFLTHASGAMVAAALTSCRSLDAFITGEKKDAEQVAIIGGGVAGLMAALTLRKAGIGFKIYEAGDSLGGRIQTVSFLTESGFSGELGAEWFSPEDEIVISLAKELGLELVQLPMKENLVKWQLGGSAQSFAPVVKDIHSRVRNQVRFTDEVQSVQDWATKMSKDSFLADFFSSYCTWRYGALASEVLAFPVLNEWAKLADASDLFLQKRIKFRNGTQNLVGAMLERVGGAFPAEVVELGSRLIALRKKVNRQELTFQRADGKTSTVSAKVVLIAVPISQLSSIDGYANVLPADVARGLSKKRMGTQIKSIYSFSEHPWKVSRAISALEQVFESSFELNPLIKVPGGVLAQTSLDGKSEGENLLSTLLPPEILPKSADYTQRWPLKKNIQGSHSFPTLEPPGNWLDYETDELFWAGEHTAGEKQGTLAGALASGHRAAERIIKTSAKGKA